MSLPAINFQTLITTGLPLSENYIIDHVSSGAFHYLLGKWIPQFTSILRPGVSSIPTWQIARNLQIGAEHFLETLTKEFGGDLIIRAGFLANEIANLGNTLDIQIRGFEQDMTNVASDIQSLLKRANSMELHAGSTSFMRLNFSEQSILKSALSTDLPVINTFDHINKTVQAGISQVKGYSLF
jgi:hypothetical protein